VVRVLVKGKLLVLVLPEEVQPAGAHTPSHFRST
jgi:hypothetical protein